MIVEQVERRVRGDASRTFESLALEAFAFQFERLAPYRALCERSGRTPATVGSWRDVPTIPAAAFATVELSTDTPRETFRSSGTLGERRSVHGHPYPDLYRAVVDATFPAAVLPPGNRPAILSLVPSRELVPDSSLGFMVDHVIREYGAPESLCAFGARGVEGAKTRSWFSARQREGRPVAILATSHALADLLEFLARIDLKFRMPAGSVVMETGGFKGRTKTVSRDELHAQLERELALDGGSVVSEYGMTELTSQAYTRTLAGGDASLFVPPPWMRVRALDPATLEELPQGETGLLAFFDLANLGSALHLLTEDLGSVEGDGFRLAGRAPDADLRGCSLLAEEMAGR